MFTPTPQQRAAIETTGVSVIVSAAAGSGKTAVLARRCAYLMCDAPPEARCAVDELLVLTFTEAAAAEMRSRIVEVLRARAAERPDDRQLRAQVLQVDTARISTIHAFCLWMLRRWFNQADLDPTAAVLDPDEALLLQQETLDKLCNELYATDRADEHPLGQVALPPSEPRASARADEHPPDREPREPLASTRADFQPSDNLNRAFQRLVDDYGLGEDRQIKQLILKLARFLDSLPKPRVWLDSTVEAVTTARAATVCDLLRGLEEELVWQQEFCAQRADELSAGDSAGFAFAERIREYAETLNQWQQQLPPSSADPAAALPQYQQLLDNLAAYKLKPLRAPKPADDAPAAAHAARDRAKDCWDQVRRLWSERLFKPFGAGSTAAWCAGLAAVAPYTNTIVKLVNAYRDAYREAKRRLDVMDFADQERLAFELLTVNGDPKCPSDLARQLQQRFAHVLVDEFQDISPIQEAIIRLASRESDPTRPNNLFVVGDVKQSIYRFRLAEPSIFLERLARFRTTDDAQSVTGETRTASSRRGSARAEARGSGEANSGQAESFGRAIPLQANFRSRPEILDAVNFLFERLMRPELGALVYDNEARLRPGDPKAPPAGHYPVELHLLPRRVDIAAYGDEDEQDPEARPSPQDDPALWEAIDREAYLIARRIHSLRDEAEQQGDELDYRDIVVLLRAASFNAERVVAGLTAQGIPSYTPTGGSLLNAREVRNVLSVLQVLDNFQQDIPLTAVLRHGLLQETLSDDELVEVRLLERSVPFHAAVSLYAERGPDAELRAKVNRLLRRLERYRQAVRRVPLAQMLGRLYEESGYLAYVGGEPNGSQRRVNLIKLHERARQFGSFRRQGLHRFLRFLEAIEEEGRDFGSTSPAGEAGSVVRVMTIHQSKGLEFPVVFVAGLGSAFNLGDRSGRMIFERQAGLGLRGVDPERMVEYPTATHRRVVQEVERTSREEELRVLYVALTRARDRLILVASTPRAERFAEAPTHPSPPTLLELATARSPLTWIETALNSAEAGEVQRDPQQEGKPLFVVRVHSADQIADWPTRRQADAPNAQLHQAVAACGPLPADEPIAPDDPEVEQVLEQIEYQYPHLAAASVRAVRAASEAKGVFSQVHNPEEQMESTSEGAFAVPPSKYASEPAPTARTRGIVTHRVLEHLDFAAAVDAAGVASELQRLTAVGLLAPREREVVDEEGIVWFTGTELGRRLRQGGADYRREFKFVARETCSLFDPTAGPLPDDAVLVRGIVDGVLVTPDALEIVDFKTDRVARTEVAQRVEHYRSQVELYARAAHRLWGKPVRKAWLVFLTPRVVASVEDLRYDAAV